MSDEYIDAVNSYSSFKTTFNATSIQSQPMLMSDIFDVSIDFIWNTPDIAKGNAAFLKVKYFLEEKMHHSILTYKDAPMVLKHLENEVIMFPYVPTNDIIAVTLHAKLNAIADGAIEIIAIKIQNTNTQPIMGYTYADNAYPQLPAMKDWVEGDYYYDKPWWFRNSPETIEHEVDENTDLTQPPEYDNVLDEIEKLVLGELELKEEGGEVIDINGWKPEIVKD